jgi:hypothetical protein
VRHDLFSHREVDLMSKNETSMMTQALCQNRVAVGLRSDGRWMVSRGAEGAPLRSFRVKEHALAYARAVALSLRSVLYVRNRCGIEARQLGKTLTYPVKLD